MHRRAALGLISCAAATGVIGCDRRTGGEARRVAIGLAIPSHVHAVAWIAERHGFFAAQRLRAEVEVLGGSAAAIRGLIAGQLDVALAGGDAVLKASWAGAELSVVAGLVDRFYHRIVAKASLGPTADLREKKIGLPFLGGPQEMAITFVLNRLGLTRSDVEIVALGKEMNLIAALEKGEIDLITSELPKRRLQRMGLGVSFDLPAETTRFPYLVVAVRRELVASDPELVKGVLAGLCGAITRYRDPARRASNLEVVREHLRSTDRQLEAELHEEAGPSLLSLPPVPSREAFRTAIALAGKRLAETELDRLIELGPLNAVRCGR